MTDINDECAICLNDLNSEARRKLPCGHIFHKKCVNTWLARKNICPLCRLPLFENYDVRIGDLPIFNYKLIIKNSNITLDSCLIKREIKFIDIKKISFLRHHFIIEHKKISNNKLKKTKLIFNNTDTCMYLFNNLKNKLCIN